MKKITLFCCGCLIAAAVQAQIIRVPADYSTIQLGINAATPGDTVLVAEGTYYEQINFLGKKPLVVASEFYMDGDTNHIANTIIDGSQIPNTDSASVVYFISGEDTTSILCGFTIRGGIGSYTANTWQDRDGGGIWISYAGAKIIHNRITGNTIDDTQMVNGVNCFGAGICTDFNDYDSWVVIEDNVIDGNVLITKNDATCGAGIYISYKSRIIHNTISDNTSQAILNGAGIGGGIVCTGDFGWSSDLWMIIHDNTIKNNFALGNIARGGGVYVSVRKVVFSNNEVTSNQAIGTSLSSDAGIGGLGIYLPQEGTMICNNIFRENSSYYWGGGLEIDYDLNDPDPKTILIENNYFLDNVSFLGGAIVSHNNPVILQNNVFNGNQAGNIGGALYLTNILGTFNELHHIATLINNSFSGNTAITTGGAIYSVNAKPLILNTNLWGDSASEGNEIYAPLSTDTVEIGYSCINPSNILANLIDGGGNLNEDPMFLDPELLTTEPWSPCVDAGIATYSCSHGEIFLAPAYDILGVPRPAGSGYDMGAYDLEYSGVGIPIVQAGLPLVTWPNPFTSTVNFSYALDEPSQVILCVFDNFGRKVAEPINAYQQTGKQQIEWNTRNLPAGIYYCRLQAGKQVMRNKIIKMQ
jgi:predicted outer membrane repeat protein